MAGAYVVRICNFYPNFESYCLTENSIAVIQRKECRITAWVGSHTVSLGKGGKGVRDVSDDRTAFTFHYVTISRYAVMRTPNLAQ
jgi:hypothetical protein